MEMSQLVQKAKTLIIKYKYAAIVLLVGIGLMLLPNFDKDNTLQFFEICGSFLQ
jgi:hypothetical protein